jgi:hypothetical protein
MGGTTREVEETGRAHDTEYDSLSVWAPSIILEEGDFIFGKSSNGLVILAVLLGGRGGRHRSQRGFGDWA